VRRASVLLALVAWLPGAFLWADAAWAATIPFGGRDWWINGVNVPWNQYGSDAGSHDSWGHLYDPAWFEAFFAECESSGINCVRLWIHCDGRSSPEFDGSGYVTGLDGTFLDDLEDILLRAESHGVMVMPCLWSFDMTNDGTAGAGPYAGLHADLIQDAARTQSYIDNALVPMLERLASAPNLFAWEIINEPEWSVLGNTDETVGLGEMQRFCAMIAEAVHERSATMVSVGSASLKWNSDLVPPAEGNWWSDEALIAAHSSALAYLDFYQVHYYDWMWDPGWGYDPFDVVTPKPTSHWLLDKPVLVGECPADDSGMYTMSEQLDNAFANGYVGVMFWSYNSDWSSNWASTTAALAAFRNAHPDLVAGIPYASGRGAGCAGGGLPSGAGAFGLAAALALLLARMILRQRRQPRPAA